MNVDAHPLEVFTPLSLSWMKQLCDQASLRIDPRKVCAFVQIAIHASQRQIIKVAATPVNLRNNMLEVQ